MNYLLIVGIIGIIAVIALVAYFTLGKKDTPIQDGKYQVFFNNPEKVDGIYYFIVSDGGKVIKLNIYKMLGDINPYVNQELNIVKSDMKVSIDGKEYTAYMYDPSNSGNIVNYIYLAQVPTGKIFMYRKKENKLELLPEIKEVVKLN